MRVQMMRHLSILLSCLVLVVVASCAQDKSDTPAANKPLQTFTLKDHLRHQWNDEIVHFPIDFDGKAPKSVTLTDADGKPRASQATKLEQKDGRVTGLVATVVTLPASQ